MIIPDINLLVYAYNSDAPLHAPARSWWEALMNGSRPVGIPWVVVLGFIRLMTHPAVLMEPLRPPAVLERVRLWFSRSHVQVLEPGPRHLVLLAGFLADIQVAGNLATDAHLAAIAVEYQCEIHSNDTDFARFSGLRWVNPLARSAI